MYPESASTPGSLVQQYRSHDSWHGSEFSSAKILRSVVLAVCALLLSSCASMNKVDCFYTDWYAKGLADGAAGATMDKFNRYVKDCSRHGVTPERSDYTDGRQKGLESYCTQSHGYEVGRFGHQYRFVCPSSLERDFLSGYNPGKRLHDAENAIESIDSNIDNLMSRNERLEREIEKFEDELLDPDTDEETRATRLRQIKRRQSEIAQNELQIREYYELKVDAIVSYRETVRELRDLGLRVVEKY